MQRAALTLLVLAGCSDDLTCELLADPSNCFAQTAAAFETCMPMRATPAKLSADGRTCTFADGVYVVFNAPVPQLNGWVLSGISFTVYAPDDSACGSVYYYSNTNDRLQVVHGSQSAVWKTPLDYPASGYELACGSQTYTASSDASFQQCETRPVVPYFDFSRSPPYTFTLSSAASQSPLFICE